MGWQASLKWRVKLWFKSNLRFGEKLHIHRLCGMLLHVACRTAYGCVILSSEHHERTHVAAILHMALSILETCKIFLHFRWYRCVTFQFNSLYDLYTAPNFFKNVLNKTNKKYTISTMPPIPTAWPLEIRSIVILLCGAFYEFTYCRTWATVESRMILIINAVRYKYTGYLASKP